MTLEELLADIERWDEWERSGFYEGTGEDKWRCNASVKERQRQHYELLKKLAPKLVKLVRASKVELPRRAASAKSAWARIMGRDAY